jgi:parvulin-like peptidyl-prolyl isomerase
MFAKLARQYSQGTEAQTSGLIGPVLLHQIHPVIAQMLFSSQPGQLWPPTSIDKYFFIVRMEQLIPAQLNESMRLRLLNELFEIWLTQEIKHQLYGVSAQSYMNTQAA